MEHLANLKDYGLHHVGFFVSNREEYMEILKKRFGIIEWQTYTYTPTRVLDGNGKELPLYRLKIAMGMVKGSECRMEVIEPFEGESYQKEWLDKNGSSMSHICYVVEDYEYWRDYCLKQGMEIIGEAIAEDDVVGKRRAIYFKDNVLGCVLEIAENTPTRK